MKNSSVIDRNGRYLLALINSILDQAQLEAGQVRIVTQPESVRALVEDVVATLKPLVRDKPVTLDAEFASGMPDMVEIDAFRVRQILLNLTGNGIKFTPQGQVRIEVSWHDSRLSISVKDTGPGLSVQAQSRLFTAFAQADDSIAAKHGGTGLGLTSSRERLPGERRNSIRGYLAPGLPHRHLGGPLPCIRLIPRFGIEIVAQHRQRVQAPKELAVDLDGGHAKHTVLYGLVAI